ncbi:DUF3710 domain-containing protein [Buchananella hordeovulneris]|uniref:DUF3710 domain-containing protein n=1 Tax=Buchananella hordeovulneris TaxID=52770 RepID=UPI000F5E9A67|nr:DUF3710 domain-containing protein [Buchananella hordeovulneris]RRD45317.1 DUF3710 domain-containing protein [Buchananella hordeovulneris]
MGLFSRRQTDTTTPARPQPTPRPPKKHGPYDISERKVRPGYLDLGALKLPQIPGIGIQMNVTPDRRSILGVTYQLGNSVMSVAVFAAPRSRGLWEEIRGEIAASIEKDGGRVGIGQGPFGSEVQATVMVPGPDGRQGVLPVRVLGIDGPRWFVRAMLRGPLAAQAPNPDKLNAAENILSAIIVERGKDPMPPRAPLELRPVGLEGEGVNVDASASPLLDPNASRGPSMTETR